MRTLLVSLATFGALAVVLVVVIATGLIHLAALPPRIATASTQPVAPEPSDDGSPDATPAAQPPSTPPAPLPAARAPSPKPAAGLVIRKAIYGDLAAGHFTDVTRKVADTVRDDRLTIGATNDLFGDPARGVVKLLQVDYTFNGKEGSKTVGEGQNLTLAPGGGLGTE